MWGHSHAPIPAVPHPSRGCGCSLRMLCPREPSWGHRSVGLAQTLHPKPPERGILTLPEAFSHQIEIWKDFTAVLGVDKHFHIDKPRPAPSFITERAKKQPTDLITAKPVSKPSPVKVIESFQGTPREKSLSLMSVLWMRSHLSLPESGGKRCPGSLLKALQPSTLPKLWHRCTQTGPAPPL